MGLKPFSAEWRLGQRHDLLRGVVALRVRAPSPPVRQSSERTLRRSRNCPGRRGASDEWRAAVPTSGGDFYAKAAKVPGLCKAATSKTISR